MILTVIIRTAANETRRWQQAQHFVSDAQDQGHTIRQVFFHSAGVLSAVHHDALPTWYLLAQRTGGEFLLCSQAVEEHQIEISPPFVVGGLGALVEAAVRADKVVSFV